MMISNKHYYGTVIAMSELTILSASVKSTLHDIARQASALGVGLQNAAPGDKSNATPNNSVQYLVAIADHLQKVAEACEKLSDHSVDTTPKP
jgi:hypothetical protein